MSRPRSRREQPWVVRLTHWVNVPLLVLAGGSGLQILAAYPYLGSRGALERWYPWQGAVPPAWLRLGGWLAGARAVHFGVAGWLLLNGALYLGYIAVSGEWRRRAFLPRRDFGDALATAAYYLRLRPRPLERGLYNGLQRLAYTTAVLLGVLVALSGVALYKPTQLEWLARGFGGYDGARAVHLVTLAALAVFLLAHVLMVALHPRSLQAMITGGKTDAPEA